MFERFTRPARQLVVAAQEEARELGHGWIGSEHLLLAALRQPTEPGAATLIGLGVTADRCRTAVTGVLGGQHGGVTDQDADALQALGIDLEEVRRRAEDAFGSGALDTPARDPGRERRRPFPLSRRRDRELRPPQGHIPFAGRAKKAMELALREAVALKDRHIGVQHVVLGLLRSDDNITRALFQQLNLNIDEARAQVLRELHEAA